MYPIPQQLLKQGPSDVNVKVPGNPLRRLALIHDCEINPMIIKMI